MIPPKSLNFNDPRVVLKDYPHWETSFPQKGESKVYVGEQVPLGYLYLASPFWIPEGTSKWYTDGQLVKVRMRRDGYAYFDNPIERTFHANGILYQVPVEVGRTYTGSGVFASTFAAEGVLRDWVVPDGWTGPKALDLQACTRMTIEDVAIGRPQDPGSYGLGLQYATNITVRSLKTRGVRHPIIPWCIARSGFWNVRHEEPAHDFDFGHGFCEDLIYADCNLGDRNGAVGNRWSAPCRNLTITGAKNARDLLVYSGSVVNVNQSRFNLLRLNQNLPGKGMRVDCDWESFTGHQREGLTDASAEVFLR